MRRRPAGEPARDLAITSHCPDTSNRAECHGPRMFKTPSILVLSLALVACSEARRDAAPANGSSEALAPASLQAAHDAYLAGNYALVARHIRSVLLDPSSTDVAKENAFELLDATYVATNGRIPTAYELPSAVKHMQLGVQHGESKFGSYRSFHLWARLVPGFGPKVTEMRVDRADGTTLFKTGMPDTTFEVKGSLEDEVVLNAKEVASPLPDGVYTVHLAINGAPLVDTWIIARHLESSAAPNVTSPGSVIGESAPTVTFEPFHSPEYADYEARSLAFYIEEKDTRAVKWTRWTGKPEELDGAATGTPLTAGSYWLAVTAGERRGFGPIELERGSQRAMSLEVVR